jgi:hypothetical protein
MFSEKMGTGKASWELAGWQRRKLKVGDPRNDHDQPSGARVEAHR